MRTKEWLIETRKKENLTQRKLAELAGISTPTIAKIESGERFGSNTTWNKIESVLLPNKSHILDNEEEKATIYDDEDFVIMKKNITKLKHKIINRRNMLANNIQKKYLTKNWEKEMDFLDEIHNDLRKIEYIIILEDEEDV